MMLWHVSAHEYLARFSTAKCEKDSIVGKNCYYEQNEESPLAESCTGDSTEKLLLNLTYFS